MMLFRAVVFKLLGTGVRERVDRICLVGLFDMLGFQKLLGVILGFFSFLKKVS